MISVGKKRSTSKLSRGLAEARQKREIKVRDDREKENKEEYGCTSSFGPDSRNKLPVIFLEVENFYIMPLFFNLARFSGESTARNRLACPNPC